MSTTTREIKKAISLFPSRAALARAVGVTRSTVCQWEKGKTKPTPRNGYMIERATNGAVSRVKLFPNDWESHWPELAETT